MAPGPSCCLYVYANPMSQNAKPNRSLVGDHRRQWRDFRYVYPVVSRRARGLSIGINLNPEKACNYSCVYCQVDHAVDRHLRGVDLEVLANELRLTLEEAITGAIWNVKPFDATPPELRRVNDIAFSGDGEPTCLPTFDKAVALAADAKRQLAAQAVKIVVITNATQLESPQVQRALPILDANNGEIWAKLDAGTEEYFRQINRPAAGVTLEKVLGGIISVAQGRPIVIQTLFLRRGAAAPSPAEIGAYCSRLRDILQAGGKIKLAQIHTVARPPQETDVCALPNEDLDAIAATVRSTLPELAVEVHYGLPK